MVAASVLVAGGGLAYLHSSFNRKKPRFSSSSSKGSENGSLSEKVVTDGKLSGGRKIKRSGMKSLNALASLLIAQMGTKGMRTLLSLAAIAVSPLIGFLGICGMDSLFNARENSF